MKHRLLDILHILPDYSAYSILSVITQVYPVGTTFAYTEQHQWYINWTDTYRGVNIPIALVHGEHIGMLRLITGWCAFCFFVSQYDSGDFPLAQTEYYDSLSDAEFNYVWKRISRMAYEKN